MDVSQYDGSFESLSDSLNAYISVKITNHSQPVEIAKCVLLRYLNLASNKLTSVPGSITVLRNLQRLNLSGNQLRSLPGDLGSLSSMVELDVAHNEIERIPSSIGLCSQV